ncbi:hypothetical protein D3C77_168790 [compost metagenome]
MGLYCVNVNVVIESIKDLMGRSLHRNLPGYLCIKRDLRSALIDQGIKPKFKVFFDEFLRVPGGVHPYFVPFSETWTAGTSPWLNVNVAGSYAPSSLRGNGAFLKVCSIDAASKLFSLRENHEVLALQHLAASQKIPALSIAVFLYRDFAFDSPQVPQADVLLTKFRDDFGYREEVENEAAQFSVLFSVDQSSIEPFFEEVAE